MHESHRTHDTGSAEDEAKETGERLKGKVGGLLAKMDECKKSISDLEKILKQNERDAIKTEREINKRADDVKRIGIVAKRVDQIRDDLILELRTASKCLDRKAEASKEEMNRQMGMMESLRKYADELISRGTPCDIVREAGKMENRAGELMKFSARVDVDHLKLGARFSLDEVNVRDLTDTKQLFGRLIVHECVTCTSNPRRGTEHPIPPPSPTPLTLLTTLAGAKSRPVFGITKFNNKLYVVTCGSDLINVFTAQPPFSFSQLADMHLRGLKTPWDIAGCAVNKCLYVVDWGSECVWRVSDTNVDKWLLIANVWRLFVAPDGNLAMIIRTDIKGELAKGQETWHGVVSVYNAAGGRLTHIKLPDIITNPHGLIQTKDKTFILSHGDFMTKLNRVVEVNNKGDIVATYGGSLGNGLGKLNSPTYIAMFGDDQVLVADTLNKRILSINRQLNKQLNVVLTWSDSNPYRLFYDREMQQIFVGFFLDGRVEIYSLK